MQEPPGVAFYGVGGNMSSFLEPVFKSIIIIQMMIDYNLFLHDWSIDENEKYSSVILVYRFSVTWTIISAADYKIENKNFSIFGVISHFIYINLIQISVKWNNTF